MVLQFNKIITFYKPSKNPGNYWRELNFSLKVSFFFLGRINISELENNFYIFSLLREFGIFTGSLIKLTKRNVLLYFSYEIFPKTVVSRSSAFC